ALGSAAAPAQEKGESPKAPELEQLFRQAMQNIGDAERLFVQRRYNEALKRLASAAGQMDQIEGKTKDRRIRINLAGARQTSASMYAAVGLDEVALKYARRAEAIYEGLIADGMIGNERFPDAKAIGYTNAHHIECLDFLARLHMKLGEYEKALPYCER